MKSNAKKGFGLVAGELLKVEKINPVPAYEEITQEGDTGEPADAAPPDTLTAASADTIEPEPVDANADSGTPESEAPAEPAEETADPGPAQPSESEEDDKTEPDNPPDTEPSEKINVNGNAKPKNTKNKKAGKKPDKKPAKGKSGPEEAEVAEPADAGQKPPRKPNKYILPVSITLLVLCLAWILGGLVFGKYQVGSTTLPFINNRQHAAAVLTAQTQKYKITVAYPDKKTKQFSLADAGLQFNADASADDAHRIRLLQFIQWWRRPAARLTFNVDQPKFNSFISNSLTVIVQPAEDAKLSINNGNIELKNSSAGKRYGLSDPLAQISEVVGYLRTAPVKLELLALNPAIGTEQVNNAKAKLEQIVKQPVSFKVAGSTVTPTASDIGTWLDLTPDTKKKTIIIDVNSGKVLDYINKLAGKYIHSPRDAVVVKSADGSSKVIVAGVNGVDVLNKSAIATEVTKKLLDAQGIQSELSIQNAPYMTVSVGEYDKWIEVDLTNKKMYAYEHTNLVNTFLVTAGAPSTPTVTGQYNIYTKYAQQDMKGLNVDGSKYFQPHVPWVNYFYKDYAIHGNYWRPLSYFGNINSSHGCVGIRPGDGEWVYNWAPVGTTVIVHT